MAGCSLPVERLSGQENMMAKRYIADSIRSDEKLNQLNHFQFRVWVHLITYVDNDGRCLCDSEILVKELFPINPNIGRPSIVSAIQTFERLGLVELHKDAGKTYLHFPKWYKYQRNRETTQKKNCAAGCGGEKTGAAGCGAKEKEEKKNQEKKLKENHIFLEDNRAREVLDYFNQRTGSHYRYSRTALEGIHARLDEGFTVPDCRKVIDAKIADWSRTDMEKNLNPVTLFRPSHFEVYLHQAEILGTGFTTKEIEAFRADHPELQNPEIDDDLVEAILKKEQENV